MVQVAITVDGKAEKLDVDADMPLLYALRNELHLKNPRFGCGLAQCGACSVIVDGQAIRSCVIPTPAVTGKAITTLAGLGSAQQPHPVQQAFIDEWALQCGYCINGWIMNTAALLEKNPTPTDTDIRQALTGLKCRCAMHHRFLRAAKRAVVIMQSRTKEQQEAPALTQARQL